MQEDIFANVPEALVDIQVGIPASFRKDVSFPKGDYIILVHKLQITQRKGWAGFIPPLH